MSVCCSSRYLLRELSVCHLPISYLGDHRANQRFGNEMAGRHVKWREQDTDEKPAECEHTQNPTHESSSSSGGGADSPSISASTIPSPSVYLIAAHHCRHISSNSDSILISDNVRRHQWLPQLRLRQQSPRRKARRRRHCRFLSSCPKRDDRGRYQCKFDLIQYIDQFHRVAHSLVCANCVRLSSIPYALSVI